MLNTFSNHNFGGIEGHYSNKENARFLILPVPYEATTTYMAGARFGPQAIIDASCNMELYDEELLQETYKAGIHTFPFIEPIAAGPEYMANALSEYITEEISKNKVLISLGGEHSISAGIIMPFKKKYPELSVLYLDAHADMRDTYQKSSYSHACTARRIQEKTPVVLTGIRSLSKKEAIFIEKSRQKIFWGKEAINNVNKVLSALSSTIYISIDVDIMDPSIMPATGTPEPNGWLWWELTKFLKEIILKKKVIGIDFVELSPIKGNPAPDFSIAKLIYRIMGYLVKLR